MTEFKPGRFPVNSPQWQGRDNEDQGTHSGVPTWVIITITVGLALVLACCGAAGIAAMAPDRQPNRDRVTSTEVVRRATPEPVATKTTEPAPTQSPGEVDRLPDYWEMFGCNDLACALDTGQPGLIRKITEHRNHTEVWVDPAADPVWSCQNVADLLYPGEARRVEVYDGAGAKQLAVFSAWSGECVSRTSTD